MIKEILLAIIEGITTGLFAITPFMIVKLIEKYKK